VRVHLARVNHHIEQSAGEATYGALVDLFISVGPGAAEVRNRALYWARDLLDAGHYRALEAHVDQGLTPAAPMPATLRSVRSFGVTGTTQLVGEAPPVVAAESSAPRLPPAPPPTPAAPVIRPVAPAPPHHSGTAARPPAPDGWFDPELTVLGAMRRYARADTAFTLAGAFGRIDVTAGAVWVRLTPGGVAALASELTQPVEIRHVEPDRVDRTGARSLDVAVWDLTFLISAGRLPLGLPTDLPLRLRHSPDLTRLSRTDGDEHLVRLLVRTPTRLADLPSDRGSCTFLAAAWMAGLLVGSDEPAEPGRSGGADGRSSRPGLARRVRGRT
jgi:hypothetical protein